MLCAHGWLLAEYSTQSKQWQIELLYRYIKQAKTSRIIVSNIPKQYLYFVHYFKVYIYICSLWVDPTVFILSRWALHMESCLLTLFKTHFGQFGLPLPMKFLKIWSTLDFLWFYNLFWLQITRITSTGFSNKIKLNYIYTKYNAL